MVVGDIIGISGTGRIKPEETTFRRESGIHHQFANGSLEAEPTGSQLAIANLGYASGRFGQSFCLGDTLSTSSKVIGLKQNRNGKTGIVSFARWEGTNEKKSFSTTFAG